jgi:TonB-linked SusC/RagA family outer membrane protein
MKTNMKGILTLLLAFVVQISFAQEKTVSGTVSDSSGTLPGVSVVIKGTSKGTQTDFDGNYTIKTKEGDILSFSYVGYKKSEKKVGSSNTINILMEEDANVLDEIVVTALGIKRDRKSLGYATQIVKGDAVARVKSSNFVNSLSGQVAGLDIKTSGTLGGSTNVVIRGSSSILGNNQALFVVDGIPIGNNNTNSGDQNTGRGGYDYGNAASDINPDDIESINVLKGAAASALYGERGSNGVIMITTKKGKKRSGIGVTINSTYMVTNADKNTLPVYQKKYGAGYGQYYDDPSGYFGLADVNGDGTDDLTTPFTEDASFGAAFDPNLNIYQWNSLYEDLDTYQKATPWAAGANDPNSVWGVGSTAVNSVSLEGGSDVSTFRLGITNMQQEGNLPNSKIKRNTITFNGTHELSEKLNARFGVTYTNTSGKGRYGTGYDSRNVMQQFRQWWQVNVDVEEQKKAYFDTRKNITWNPKSATDLVPIYSDNPYWTFFENFSTDSRDRYFGNFALDYEVNDWISLLGRFTFDTYSEFQEERINVGSNAVSEYSRYNNNVSEYNYDFIATFNKKLNDKFNLDGNVGFSLRRNTWNSIRAATNGGLNLPGVYTLDNSKNPITPDQTSEYDAVQMVDGYYGRATLAYDGKAYLEGTFRRDRNSSLPKTENTYNYWSVTGSIILSEFIEKDWLNFAKLRANYGTVGSGTVPYRVFDAYTINAGFDQTGSASNPGRKNNPNLRPEQQQNWEVGLEANLFDRRLGFDVTYYEAKNIDQITAVPVSNATGFTSVLLNAGTIQNKGIEVQLTGNPVRTDDFRWDVNVNWSRNRNELLSLADGIENLELGSFQGGVSINATPGSAVGIIRGSDLVYHSNGQPIVDQTGSGTRIGKYQTTATSNEIIGDTNPDWTGGIRNSFKYKNFDLSFLIDIQSGGDVFSLDTWYGYGTGLYDFTAGTNDLGNPVRNTIANGGGLVLPGVAPDGTTNTVRTSADNFANPWGWARSANSQHVYDASFVKLREMNLTYNFEKSALGKTFTAASISIIGRNLWIIHKNTPYSDPEAGLSSGNLQGMQSGSYPSVTEVGASLKLKF